MNVTIAPDAPFCATHEGVVAVATCSRCGTFTCAECMSVASSGDEFVCLACAERDPPDLLAWEKRGELGWFRAWWKTTVDALIRPGTTFSRARTEGPIGGAILYAAISWFIGFLGTGLLYVAMFGVIPLQQPPNTEGLPVSVRAVMVGTMALMLILAPVFGVVGTLATAAVDHLILRLAGVKSGYETSLRASAYSLAPGVLGVIPFCSMYMMPVWMLVVRFFAYRGLHRTTTGKALAAALIAPVAGVLLCGGWYAFLLYVTVNGMLSKS